MQLRKSKHMKYLFIFLAGGLLWSCNTNEASTTNNTATDANNTVVATDANTTGNESLTSIQWLDSTHQELGKIKEGQVVEITWRFKNTGTKPLVITNVSASCGCTVPAKPEKPIAPGGEDIIKAQFDSKDRVGPQRKDVYVEANTDGSRSTQLSFALEVIK